jgi:hypothetical protein
LEDIGWLLLQAIILFGLWKWRKIAVYAFFVIYAAILPSGLMIASAYGSLQQLSLGEIIVRLSVYIAFFCLFFLAFKRKWHLFR